VARLGGDEFTFLVEDLSDEREIVLIADRISRAANLPIPLERGRASVSVSIGIAMLTGQAVEPETLIREADAAMYRSKRRGRGSYELFDERSRERALERLELETSLRQALDRSELQVHYQPGVSLDGQSINRFEALVRWHHPERGLLAPSEFLPLAEETGLMIPIGRFVLGQALARLEAWRRRLPDMTLSVNLSASQLDDALGLISTLLAALAESTVDPAALCLEIPESAIGSDPDAAVVALRELKSTGVRLAIDDFGLAAPSLAHLKELPIDTIKLHGSLLSGLESDPREAPILEAVVELGHALGCGVVAEGVETEAQASALGAIGCDAAQGFLFGPPVPEEEVERLLAEAGYAELRPVPSRP
jgi:predicted signal transduction protein with EAL and GGDEF domain